MSNEIVDRALNDLRGIGLPGSAVRLQEYIETLEKKSSETHTLDREQWRYVFAGQAMQGVLSSDKYKLSGDYECAALAAKHADELLTILERTK